MAVTEWAPIRVVENSTYSWRFRLVTTGTAGALLVTREAEIGTQGRGGEG